MIDACIAGLLRYAEDTGLIEADDRLWARNRLLEALQLDGCDPNCAPAELPLADLLRELTEDAVSRGVAQDNSVARDLFDTKLMGVLTPAPHEVRAKFRSLYAVSPERATDWFYAFSQNTNYIRRDRIARDQKWVYESAYGPLDITINLSKPEKDPRAIAAAKLAPQSGYPKCALIVFPRFSQTGNDLVAAVVGGQTAEEQHVDLAVLIHGGVDAGVVAAAVDERRAFVFGHCRAFAACGQRQNGAQHQQQCKNSFHWGWSSCHFGPFRPFS